jgi:acetyltransferase-like isoleucine patch superfamily enzyme
LKDRSVKDSGDAALAWGRRRLDAFIVLFHALAVAVIGLALFPAVSLLYFSWQGMRTLPAVFKVLVFSLLLAPAYFVFGITLVLVSVLVRRLLGLGIRPGTYQIYRDFEVIRWIGSNLFVLVVNACFLDGFRVSPFQNFFYRAMGARIGRGARINTSGLADLELVEIGEDAVIGGGTTLICHLADRGRLKVAPVRIGRRCSIGIDTIVMPGVEIGDDAVIGPRSLVPPGMRIPPRGRFGGDPLRDLRETDRNGGGQPT